MTLLLLGCWLAWISLVVCVLLLPFGKVTWEQAGTAAVVAVVLTLIFGAIDHWRGRE